MTATKFFASIAAAALTMTAGIAQAAEPTPAATVAPLAAVAPAAAPLSGVARLSQRYCIVDDVTGSRIRRRECASLAEWQVRGVDPRKMPVMGGR